MKREEYEKIEALFLSTLNNMYYNKAIKEYSIKEYFRCVSLLKEQYGINVHARDREKFKIFLEFNYLPNFVRLNDPSLIEIAMLNKTKYLLSRGTDLDSYDKVFGEIDDKISKLEIKPSISAEKVKESYDDFMAGKVPSACAGNERNIELYNERIKDNSSAFSLRDLF